MRNERMKNLLKNWYVFLILHAISGNVYSQVVNSNVEKDEYSMSHLNADSGSKIGLALPSRIIEMPKKWYEWKPMEYDKVKVIKQTGTSATVQLLKSGTTVVNYNFRYVENNQANDEKQIIKEGSYPFTIIIKKVSPESVIFPQVIHLGWDLRKDISSMVRFYPEYAEDVISFTVDDPTIASHHEYYPEFIVGRKLGETVIHIRTSAGLVTHSQVVVEIPEVTSVEIVDKEKDLLVGDSIQLNYTFSPKCANPQFTFTTDNPQVMAVDETTGVVTALLPGKATITISNGKDVKGKIKLHVKKK